MKEFWLGLKAYARGSLKHPIRIAAAVLTGGLLLYASGIMVGNNPKKLLICAILSLGTAAMIALPAWDKRINIALLFLYLLFAPMRIFQRIELPIHDMSRLVDGVDFFTIWLLLCVYLLIYLISQRTNVALGVGNIILSIIFLVEYFLNEFRQYVIMPSDIAAARTALNVIHSYQFKISLEVFYTLLHFIFFTSLGFRINVKINGKKGKVAASVGSLAVIAAFYLTVMHSDTLERMGITGHYIVLFENHQCNGTLLSFFVVYKDIAGEKPSDYSVERVEEIAERTAEEYTAEINEVHPNIIMIMNEAWSDLQVLGDFETSEPVMPFVEGMKENTVKGNMYVSILGGLTANTEYEVLTGDTLTLLPPTTIPYISRVDHDVDTLAGILRGQGYSAIAIHAGASAAWERNKVYPHYGFEDFYDLNAFATEFEALRDYTTDESNYREIIYRYENRDPNKPFFLFNVTIQNHGSYYVYRQDNAISILSVNGISAENIDGIGTAEEYLNLIKLSDDAFSELVAYFEQVEEPTVICMFGDHQPILPDSVYEAAFEGRDLDPVEQNLLKYITPYVIWSNYDINAKEYGDFSANYFSSVLLEYLGMEMPPYYKFLRDLQQELPVVTLWGGYDAEGNVMTRQELNECAQLKDYHVLVYCHIYDVDAPKDVFLK